MLKFLKIYYKPLLWAIVLSFVGLVITNSFGFFYTNHIMLLIPFCFTPITYSKNTTNEMINLSLISIIYLFFNPVNLLLQLWLIFGVLVVYLYFEKREIRESKISNISNLIILATIFVIGYYILVTFVNNQFFNINLRIIMSLIGNVLSLVLMIFIGEYYCQKHPFEPSKYNL